MIGGAALSASKRRALLAGLLLAVTVGAHLPALDAGYIWDDGEYLWANPNLKTAAGLWRIWADPRSSPQYYPLVFTSYWLEYRIWGTNPRGYHAVNVLLHGTNAVLLALLLQTLAVPGAWVAAFIFAVHPVHVESVAWVSERKNVLSGALYLSSLLAFVRFAGLGREAATASPRHGPGPDAPEQGSWGLYGISLGLYCGALLSKTVTASLPVAALLICWWKRRSLVRRDWLTLLPFLAVGLPLGLLTIWLERHHVGAQGADWAFSVYERTLIAGRAFWFYLWKLAWPRELLFFYPRWKIDAGDWRQALFPLAAAALLAGLWSARGRIGKGPCASLAFFGITLAPALGFVNTWPMLVSFVADHFQYLASIGPVALAAALAASAFSLLPRPSPARGAAIALLGSGLALLAYGSWRQEHHYRTFEMLLRQTIAGNPESWVARNFLASELADRSRIDEAIEQYAAVAALRPADFEQQRLVLGCDLAVKGNTRLALANFGAVLRVNPRNALAHNQIGVLLAQQGDIGGAIPHFTEALRLEPGFAEARQNLQRALQSDSPGAGP